MKVGTKRRLLKCCNYGCLAFFCAAIATIATGMGFTLHGFFKKGRIAKENGYDDFNSKYRIEQTEEILEQFKNGEINDENELSSKLKQVKNYDKQKYVLNFTTPEIAEKYLAAEKQDSDGMKMIACGMVACVPALACAYGSDKLSGGKKRRRQEKISKEIVDSIEL